MNTTPIAHQTVSANLQRCTKIKVLLTVFVVAFCTIQAISCDDIVVEVQQGTLAGEVVNSILDDSEIYCFKGIPYAKPPVDDLRFKAPVDPESWNGTRDATQFGSACPEYNSLTQVYTAGSEDCLYLNVYTPNLAPPTTDTDTLLPVIVFIGGYAFKFDTAGLNLYGPDFLVPKGVVLVTFNHRLGPLGFLSLGTEEVPGNAGFKDQVAVLKWVQNNIENFGGDPSSVTLLGHSSGSASVVYHMASPMSRGLFQRAIPISGVPSCDPIYTDKVEERSFLLGKLLGYETTNGTELQTTLRNVTNEKLLKATCAITTSEAVTNEVIFKKMNPFVAVLEKDLGQERFLTQYPMKSLRLAEVNTVDVMFGHVDQESLLGLQQYLNGTIELYDRYPELFVPYKILLVAPPETVLSLAKEIIKHYFGEKTISVDNIAEFINYANFALMVYDTHRFANMWPQVGNTYFFKFSGYSSRNLNGLLGSEYGIEGTAHGDILNYIFNPVALNMSLEANTTEYTIVQQITSAITNFAKYGNPSPDSALGVEWPQWDNHTMYYADISDTVEISTKPDLESVEFWRSILEKANLVF